MCVCSCLSSFIYELYECLPQRRRTRRWPSCCNKCRAAAAPTGQRSGHSSAYSGGQRCAPFAVSAVHKMRDLIPAARCKRTHSLTLQRSQRAKYICMYIQNYMILKMGLGSISRIIYLWPPDTLMLMGFTAANLCPCWRKASTQR